VKPQLYYYSLLLRLDLPSTLIRHENGALRKTPFKPEEFENTGWTDNILKTKLSENDDIMSVM